MRFKFDPIPTLNLGIPFLAGSSYLATPSQGTTWWVDTVSGKAGNTGHAADRPLSTMSAALALAQTGDTICFVGDVREEVVCSNLKFDITIIGTATRPHHPDSPGAGYDTGASCWRPPASPTASTPLIELRGRGWRFVNILFDCPVDAAAVLLKRNALSGTSEYDASHASFVGCRFTSGQSALENDGGCGFVHVKECEFYDLTNGIKCLSTAVAVPLRWKIEQNSFVLNTNHLNSSFTDTVIRNNQFIRHTTVAINTKFNTNQGAGNVVVGNALGGTYSIAGGYTPTTTDEWGGNANSIAGGWTAALPA